MHPPLYVHAPDGVYGPYDLATLQQWIAVGQLTPQQFLSFDGQSYFPAGNIWPQLIGQAPFAPPAGPTIPQHIQPPNEPRFDVSPQHASPTVRSGRASEVQTWTTQGKVWFAFGILTMIFGCYLLYYFHNKEVTRAPIRISNWFTMTIYRNFGKWGVFLTSIGAGVLAFLIALRENKVKRKPKY